MTARAALLIALASCGDNLSAVETSARCTATFSGNFAESSTLDPCAIARLDTSAPGHTTLELTIPSTALGASLTAQLDLGVSPSPGAYSSRSVLSWSARAVQHVGDGVCLYGAGTSAVPAGSFELTLDTIAPIDATTSAVHGALELVQYVLAFPSTDCGDGDTELVEIDF